MRKKQEPFMRKEFLRFLYFKIKNGNIFHIFSSNHIVVYPCDIKLFFRRLVHSQAHHCRGWGGVGSGGGLCVCVGVFLLQQNWSRCSFSTLIFASEALSFLNVSFNKCLSGFRGFLGGSSG